MLHVDDDGFVRAPAGLVYRRLTDIGRWPQFWPGVTVAPLATEDEQWALRMDASRRRGLRLVVRPHGYQHEHGFHLRLSGDLRGNWETWLEPTHGGTVIHFLVGAETDHHPVATLRTFRTALRRGLWGLKDDLHVEVRSAVGLEP